MVDLMQWRSTIGCFNSKYNCYIGCKYTNDPFKEGMLHTAMNACTVMNDFDSCDTHITHNIK